MTQCSGMDQGGTCNQWKKSGQKDLSGWAGGLFRTSTQKGKRKKRVEPERDCAGAGRQSGWSDQECSSQVSGGDMTVRKGQKPKPVQCELHLTAFACAPLFSLQVAAGMECSRRRRHKEVAGARSGKDGACGGTATHNRGTFPWWKCGPCLFEPAGQQKLMLKTSGTRMDLKAWWESWKDGKKLHWVE